MCRPYQDTPNNCRTVSRISLTPSIGLYGFSTGLRHPGAPRNLAGFEGKRCTAKNSYHDKRYIRPVDMQCSTQKSGTSKYSSVEWSKTGLYSLTAAV